MSSETTMSPLGGVDSRHVMDRCSLDSITVAQVLERENLQKAWKQVKVNKGAPGIDGMSVEEFPEYAFTHWEGIKTALLEGTYQPSPVKRVEIPKDSGGMRPLGILIASYNRRSLKCLPRSSIPISQMTVTRLGLTVPPIKQYVR
jgi:RNA-directed DNA polymerase